MGRDEYECECFNRIYSEMPSLLDSVYWIESVICAEFPALQTSSTSIFYGDIDVHKKNSDPNNYVVKVDANINTAIADGSKEIYIRISNIPALSGLFYYKVLFNRNFDEKAFCYFVNAICRFYNKINPQTDRLSNTIIECLKGISGRRLRDVLGKSQRYNMPRSLRARYVFATNMAFFDFVIGGGYVKDETRSFFRDLLSVLGARAFQTYEGKHRPFSCIIDGSCIVEKDDQQHYIRLLDFLESKESYLFANGYWTYFRISKNGYLLDYVNDSLSAPSSHEREYVVFTPSNYSRLASECKNENIGIVLCADGEILVFKKKALILSKRKGVWHYHDQSAVVDIIKTSIEELGTQDKPIDHSQARQLANYIFASIIDVSFAHSGGCIGIVQEGEKIGEDVLCEQNIKTKGFVDQKGDSVIKSTLLKCIISHSNASCKAENKPISFGDTDREIQMELLSLDGATVINQCGKYLAIGYILNSTLQSESGGGRDAAARMLGSKGLGIKISEDGEVKLYRKRGNNTSGTSDVSGGFEEIKIFI